MQKSLNCKRVLIFYEYLNELKLTRGAITVITFICNMRLANVCSYGIPKTLKCLLGF